MTALWIVLALVGWTLVGLPFAVLLGRHVDRHGRAELPATARAHASDAARRVA